ncbi:GMP synthase (glutamine-hydrolyzing) [Psychromicrobium silvestre]|uniref:GMP synthase (Glutamine-hydrolyzing) n=1 Tax=Psychromicrobium silvestre TaxID=1645614 RepID=A0A7Y9LSR7_9MICC|nr:GMP synthase (glutamine-hydrolyzing) [Psychromicrobium silvestre]
MKYVLILQHVAVEGPGLIASALDAKSVPWRLRNLLTEAQPELPPLSELAGVVLMGGPMDAGDTQNYPALGQERALVRSAIQMGLPVLGVCLGHQIIALALDAGIDYAASREIGLGPVQATGELAILAGLDVVHWHTDNARLPEGAELLASTEGCANQAFRFGSALGLQFHLELDEPLLKAWLDSGMDQDLGAESTEDLLAEFARGAVPRERAAARIFGDFAACSRVALGN